jgi:hypothetical protein
VFSWDFDVGVLVVVISRRLVMMLSGRPLLLLLRHIVVIQRFFYLAFQIDNTVPSTCTDNPDRFDDFGLRKNQFFIKSELSSPPSSSPSGPQPASTFLQFDYFVRPPKMK